MATIHLFLCTLEHSLKMTTIQLRAFLDAQHDVVHDILAHRPRNGSHLLPYGFLRSVMVRGFPEYTYIEICTQSLCMGSFVLHVRKCTELMVVISNKFRTNASGVHKNSLIAIIFWHCI